MKKRLIGLLLSALMLLPLLSSCSREVPPVDKEIPIYTLYTIADTTPEALRAVELALNRILAYDYDVAVDIVAVSENEYDELINNKLAEMDAIEAAKKSKGSKAPAASSSMDTSSDSVANTGDKMTADRIIETLEEGNDIHPKTTRFDVFLVRGYHQYYELAKKGKLAAINDKLSSEAKLIKDYLHGSLFTAATIDKKIYGVPINGALGDYKYIVFDSDLIEKYNFEPKTMVTVDDLDEYLEIIKKNEPDVVPLKDTVDTRDYSFMFEDGFPFYVDVDNNVLSTYEEDEIPTYYAKLARYRTLGYFTNAQGNNDGRFAVTFVKGDETTIENLSKESGQNLVYNVYQNPVATNESAIKNLYCVHKSVVSNELTNVSELLVALFTDSRVQNILTYGVENVNYRLNDDGQVQILNNDYRMNPDYTGNKFLTYTLEGEDPKKWEKIIEQNKLSTASRSLGFEMYPKTMEAKDKSVIYEPDFKAILKEVTAKYYQKFLDGTIVDVNLDEVRSESEKAVLEELREELTQTYESNISAEYAISVRKQITSSKLADELKQEATETVMNELISSVRNKLQEALTSKFRKEFPDASDEEIQAKIDAELTDEYVNEHLYDDITKEEVEAQINEAYESEITSRINEKVSDYLSSDAYTNAVERAIKSAKFTSDLNNLYSKNGPSRVDEKIDETIAAAIQEAAKAMIDEYNTEIEAAVNKFIEDNTEKLGITKEEIYAKLGYYKEVKSTDSKDKKVTYEPQYDSYFEYVYKEKVQKPFNQLYPVPEK